MTSIAQVEPKVKYYFNLFALDTLISAAIMLGSLVAIRAIGNVVFIIATTIIIVPVISIALVV